MAGELGDWIATAALYMLIGSLIVLAFPWRRGWRLTLVRTIAAPRERVWLAYRGDPENSHRGPLDEHTVSIETVSENPEVREYVLDRSKGHRTNLVTVRTVTLAEDAPAHHASCITEVDGRPHPFGAEQVTSFDLSDDAGGTRAKLTWRGETVTLFQLVFLWIALRRAMAILRRFCELGPQAAASRVRRGRSAWVSLSVSVIAVGSFALWFGWPTALILAGVLVLHEFGHWLAMRMTGQPAPRMFLVPFFGGIAVANHPHRTLFDDAFCSLMGAGLSALVCLGLFFTGLALGLPDFDRDSAGLASFDYETVAERLAVIAVLGAFVVGIVNALQLLPVLPLDGGQVLRALGQSFSARWARLVLLGVTGAGASAFAYRGHFLIAGLLAFGMLQAWHLRGERPKARPMKATGVVAIVIGFAATLAAHGGVVFHVDRLLGFGLF